MIVLFEWPIQKRLADLCLGTLPQIGANPHVRLGDQILERYSVFLISFVDYFIEEQAAAVYWPRFQIQCAGRMPILCRKFNSVLTER